jgi:hypothetical protein
MFCIQLVFETPDLPPVVQVVLLYEYRLIYYAPEQNHFAGLTQHSLDYNA